jgi:hypothetical protein
VLPQLVIDQVYVVTLFADGGQGGVVACRPFDGEAHAVLVLEHVAGDHVVVLVIVDEEDAHLILIKRAHAIPAALADVLSRSHAYP